jgi:acyl carrier protein
MEEKIKNLIETQFSKKVDLTTNLTELAGDSFGKVEMLFALEEQLGKKIPEQEITDIETVQDLIDAVGRI